MNHVFPFNCLPRWRMGRQFLDRCKHGVLSYTVVRLLTAGLTLVRAVALLCNHLRSTQTRTDARAHTHTRHDCRFPAVARRWPVWRGRAEQFRQGLHLDHSNQQLFASVGDVLPHSSLPEHEGRVGTHQADRQVSVRQR